MTPGDNDYETADRRNNFETVHGMPVYYGGNLYDSDCETPGDNDYGTLADRCDSDIWDRYCGFPPDDEDAQLPVIICAPVLRGKHMDEPLRVWPDNWDASVSVVHVNPYPVVAVLSPETILGDQLEAKRQTNASSVLQLNSLGSRFPMGGGVMTCYAY